MTQNTNNNWTNTTEVMTDVNSLVLPFNPERVAELVNLQFTIPPVAFAPVGAEDTRLIIGLPNPVTQADIDDALAKLNAICVDPTRNDPTAEQQEAEDLAAELASIQGYIDDANTDIGAINDPGGLRDQINADTTGLIDQLLTNAAWNLTPVDDQADILRTVVKALLVITRQHLTISVHEARADKFELREIRSIRNSQ